MGKAYDSSKYRREERREYGTDYMIYGEAERIIGRLTRRALNGGSLPSYLEVGPKDSPSLDEISEIRNSSINGSIKIGRGCPKGCSFCSVTLKPIRWHPLENRERVKGKL